MYTRNCISNQAMQPPMPWPAAMAKVIYLDPDLNNPPRLASSTTTPPPSHKKKNVVNKNNLVTSFWNHSLITRESSVGKLFLYFSEGGKTNTGKYLLKLRYLGTNNYQAFLNGWIRRLPPWIHSHTLARRLPPLQDPYHLLR